MGSRAKYVRHFRVADHGEELLVDPDGLDPVRRTGDPAATGTHVPGQRLEAAPAAPRDQVDDHVERAVGGELHVQPGRGFPHVVPGQPGLGPPAFEGAHRGTLPPVDQDGDGRRVEVADQPVHLADDRVSQSNS